MFQNVIGKFNPIVPYLYTNIQVTSNVYLGIVITLTQALYANTDVLFETLKEVT